MTNIRQHGTVVRLNGEVLDIPPAVRGWTQFTSQQRADMQSSHRLGYRQRSRVGEVFWTHPYCPGVCFPTSTRALEAALRTLSTTEV